MRVTEPYIIFPRTLKSGKIVYYYQFRDENGLRSAMRSTGCTSLPQAKRFCQKLYNAGEFSHNSSKLFKTFAVDFFNKDKEWYKWKVANMQEVTDSTLTSYVRLLNNQVLPFFSEMQLGRITTSTVKEWIIWCTENWSAKTTNNAQSVLNIVLKSAQEKGFIKVVPSSNLSFRKVDKIDRQLLTVEEIKKVLNSDKWFEQKDRLAFLLICITGMREGECVGLRIEDVKDNHLLVRRNYHPKFKEGATKTKIIKVVPLPVEVIAILKGISGDSWVFERNGKPVPAHTLYMSLIKICTDIGIDTKERGITLHSMRDFYNSYLRGKNIPDAKIKAVIGHKDEDMTDHYTYWTPEMLSDVYDVQLKLYKELI